MLNEDHSMQTKFHISNETLVLKKIFKSLTLNAKECTMKAYPRKQIFMMGNSKKSKNLWSTLTQ